MQDIDAMDPRQTFLTHASARAVQPAGSKVTLWPHQLAMLQRCLETESRVANTAQAVGVIGDIAGAGKTFVVLSLAMSRPGCTVVVVPHNIYSQWRDSIERFAPGLRYTLIADYAAISALYFPKEDLIRDNDILLVTNLYYGTLASTLTTVEKRVSRVVFDEVDSIAGSLQHKTPASMVWLVSATVERLAEKGRIKAGVYDVSLEHVPVCKCTPAFVKASTALLPPRYAIVLTHNQHVDCMAAVLKGADMIAANTYDFSGISTKARDAKEALEALLQSFVEDIAECESVLKEQVDPKVDRSVYRERLANSTAKLKALRARIAEGCDRARAVTPAPQAYGTSVDSDKLDNALLVITTRRAESPDARFIVFSDSARILTDMQSALNAGGVACGALDGGTAEAIDRDATKFRSGETPVLMVDSSMFGCGMDFPCATDVLIMHDLSEEMTHQVVGRAQRPGRTGALNVFKFLHDNELAA